MLTFYQTSASDVDNCVSSLRVSWQFFFFLFFFFFFSWAASVSITMNPSLHPSVHSALFDLSPLVVGFLMLSGSDSWRTDRHTLPAIILELCIGSCKCNELQSGLFGMLLIINENIWAEQLILKEGAIWQSKCIPYLCELTPWWFTNYKWMYYIYVSPCLFAIFVYRFVTSCTPVSFSVSLQHRVQRWLTLSNRLMLASNTTQVTRLSCIPSSICPYHTPALFLTFVDSMTGRDSQLTRYIPRGLGYITLGLQ